MKNLVLLFSLVFLASCSHYGKHQSHHENEGDGHSCSAKNHDSKEGHGAMCGGKHAHGKGEKKLKMMDANNDGKVSKAEFDEKHGKMFKKMDSNSDGFLSKEELENCDCHSRDHKEH